MTNYTIRQADVKDNDKIAQLSVVSWQESYQLIFAADFLSGLSWEQRATGRQKFFTDPQRTSFVIEIDGQIVGFCDAGPARIIEDIKSIDKFFSEIYAIYVLQKYKGHGIGRMLFTAAINYLQNYNYTHVIVWTLVDNNSAIKFYRKVGLAPTDWHTRTEVGGKSYDELAMCAPLN